MLQLTMGQALLCLRTSQLRQLISFSGQCLPSHERVELSPSVDARLGHSQCRLYHSFYVYLLSLYLLNFTDVARKRSEKQETTSRGGRNQIWDNGVDISEFQVFDIELNSPLDYSRKQVLAWQHEYLGVPSSEHCFRISMLMPKLRENGWRWELYEASNTKKQHFLVSKALEHRYCNIMLVEFLNFF